MNKVYFVVDDISDEQTFGWTTSMTKIFHNIDRLPKQFSEAIPGMLEKSDDGLTIFMGLGRYICHLTISRDKSNGAMAFYDTYNNDEHVEAILNRFFQSPTQREEFLEIYQQNKPHYESDYDYIELTTIAHFMN